MMNLYLELSSFEFFFEPFFSDFSTLAEVLMLPALPSFPSPLLAFFRSTYMHNRASNVCVYRNRKKRLIWHKNILRVRYYFLWFFVMIVIPNTHLFRLPKKTPKLLQIHLPSGITSILNVYLRQIWSKLKIFCNF